VPDPATPIVSLAETQLQIQAAATSAHDAVAVGVLGVDVGLLAAAVTVGSALAPDRYPSLVAIGVSGLLALVALLQAGVDMGATPAQLYELTDGLTEEAISNRLIVYLDEIVVETNSRLRTKASLLGAALTSTIVALTIALATI
jgi:hypothetical protein